MEKKKGKVGNEADNLSKRAPELAKLISDMNLSHIYIAERLYYSEWDKNDEAVKRRLAGRLRNKISGNGKLTLDELVQIQNILMEMADIIKKKVHAHILATAEERKRKIEVLLRHFEDEEKEPAAKEKKEGKSEIRSKKIEALLRQFEEEDREE